MVQQALSESEIRAILAEDVHGPVKQYNSFKISLSETGPPVAQPDISDRRLMPYQGLTATPHEAHLAFKGEIWQVPVTVMIFEDGQGSVVGAYGSFESFGGNLEAYGEGHKDPIGELKAWIKSKVGLTVGVIRDDSPF